MIKDEKQQIAARLKEYCEKMGSQNKAARSLNGISTATVSKMLTGQWDTISDELWRGVAAQIGHDTSAWQIVKTGAYRRMEFLMAQVCESVLLAMRGEFKEFPLLGAEVRQQLGGCVDPFWPQETKKMLRACKVDAETVELNEDGTLTIE